MATGQTLLNLMEYMFPELQLQSGEADVTKGLVLLNAAQDLFETFAAQHPQVSGSTSGTLTTTAAQEYTTFPTGVMRIDGLDMLDPSTLLPEYPLGTKRKRGGHRQSFGWWNLVSSSTTDGKPAVYWTNGLRIYWDPVPDAVYSIRWYGFKAADDITASGTFAYSDAAQLPLASLAARIARAGLDDPSADYTSIAKDTLDPLMDALSGFNRDGAHGMRYEYTHDT